MQKSADIALDDARLAQLEKTGFYLEMDLDVKPGDYALRGVARDSNDRHILAQNANIKRTAPNLPAETPPDHTCKRLTRTHDRVISLP